MTGLRTVKAAPVLLWHHHGAALTVRNPVMA